MNPFLERTLCPQCAPLWLSSVPPKRFIAALGMIVRVFSSSREPLKFCSLWVLMHFEPEYPGDVDSFILSIIPRYSLVLCIYLLVRRASTIWGSTFCSWMMKCWLKCRSWSQNTALLSLIVSVLVCGHMCHSRGRTSQSLNGVTSFSHSCVQTLCFTLSVRTWLEASDTQRYKHLIIVLKVILVLPVMTFGFILDLNAVK